MALRTDIQSESGAAPVWLEPGVDGKLTVSDAALLFDATFLRSGNDLQLLNAGAAPIRIADYFTTDTPAAIFAPNGAMLSGEAVAQLAGPLLPGQYAQTAQASATEAIGQVETLDGASTVQRADGTIVTLDVGQKIFANDVVQTQDGATVSIPIRSISCL